jgi:hypothetical protein
MNKNLYAILGVDKTATQEAMASAYEALVAQIDPKDAVKRMAVKEAWSTLGHEQRRAAYDASLHESSRRKPVMPMAETSAFNKTPWLAGLALLLVVGGWWSTRSARHVPVKVSTSRQIMVGDAGGPGRPMAPTSMVSNDAPSNRQALSSEALFAQASVSVVRINVYDSAGEGTALGSGVVIERGIVITNCHVAKAGARLKVKYQREQYDASVIMADEQHDLCKLSVLSLNAPPVSLGKVANLHVGQKVYAIGSPQGLDLTLSDGMVSSLREGADGTIIQTTAPVSPGSSGGGLFTEQGVLVGIVTFQARSGQNLNFAIPADWITTISSTSAPERERDDERNASARPQDAMATAILGGWNCFGPLTGRGFAPVFERDGTVSGMSDGKPLTGHYYLSNKQLTLSGSSSLTFQVEELSASRMVMSRGEGRRLACNR